MEYFVDGIKSYIEMLDDEDIAPLPIPEYATDIHLPAFGLWEQVYDRLVVEPFVQATDPSHREEARAGYFTNTGHDFARLAFGAPEVIREVARIDPTALYLASVSFGFSLGV